MTAADTRLRAELAVEAASEVESIGRLLQGRFSATGPEYAFVRGLGIRLEALAGVVLIVGNTDPIAEACATLEGPEVSRQRRGTT